MVHIPWHCDTCGKPNDKLTWTADDNTWRCDPCEKSKPKPVKPG